VIRKIITFLFIFLVLLLAAFVVFIYFIPTEKYIKRNHTAKWEMRAVWVSTFMNVDWPRSTKISQEEQKQNLIEQLDIHAQNNMNTIIFQVRPSADAFYNSSFEPWSQWLTGKQGQAPTPFYDPLQFAIEQVHKRNMEFHAWFNPYRAMADTAWKAELDSNNIILKKPEWFVAYGRGLYFNPGIPEVQQYIIKIVLDVVRRYDIDAVHFDDYFYPYKIPDLEFEDAETFKKYGANIAQTDISQWRRENVNSLIKTLADSIKAVKPYVKFGISPFGVWRNSDVDKEGTLTQAGQPSYDATYADTRKWVKEGWVDYITPQIYWHIGHERADFDEITNWWRKNHYNRHLYIGHGIYKLSKDASEKQWRSAQQIITQVEKTRTSPEIKGSMFFSSFIFTQNPKKINTVFQQQLYKYRALVPKMEWIDSIAPQTPINFNSTENTSGIVLTWQNKKPAGAMNEPYYYILYQFRGKDSDFSLNNGNIYAITRQNKFYLLQESSFFSFLYKEYTFVVTAVDRQNNESKPSLPIVLKLKTRNSISLMMNN